MREKIKENKNALYGKKYLETTKYDHKTSLKKNKLQELKPSIGTFSMERTDLDFDQRSHSLGTFNSLQNSQSSCDEYNKNLLGIDDHDKDHLSHSSKCLTPSSISTVEGRILLKEQTKIRNHKANLDLKRNRHWTHLEHLPARTTTRRRPIILLAKTKG